MRALLFDLRRKCRVGCKGRRHSGHLPVRRVLSGQGDGRVDLDLAPCQRSAGQAGEQDGCPAVPHRRWKQQRASPFRSSSRLSERWLLQVSRPAWLAVWVWLDVSSSHSQLLKSEVSWDWATTQAV